MILDHTHQRDQLLKQALGLPASSSVIAAHTVQRALHALGYTTARVAGVGVAVLNPVATDSIDAGLPLGSWPADACIHAIEGSDAIIDGRWDGHAVVIVSEQTPGRRRKWLLDPTLGQFSNPECQIRLGPAVARASADFLACETMEITFLSGTTLWYQRQPLMTGHLLDDCDSVVTEMAALLQERLLP